jgi:penicillin-binding protein 2
LDTFSGRKSWVIGIFIVTGIIFILRLFQIQVADSDYKESAQKNALRKLVQYPARGLIYDRNHELLVYNKPSYDLLFTPREAGIFDTVAVSRLLGVSVENLRKEMKKAAVWSTYKPSVIIKQITSEKYASIQEKFFKLKGFIIQPRTLREYPKPLAAHVLGYVGEVTQNLIDTNSYYQSGDYIGISGVETAYEEDLRGDKGVKYFMVDVHNRLQGRYRNGELDTAARIGRNLVLSLDSRLQEYAELLLQNKKGSIVAIEPSTGEVLVLANAPSYNPNLMVGKGRGINFSSITEDPARPFFNRAVMALYPPGSTVKMAQALIALQEGVINPPDTILLCIWLQLRKFQGWMSS